MEERKLWALYVITHTGSFTAVQGARPVEDISIVHDLEAVVEKVRPGRGKYYELYIARCTDDWQPTVADLVEIRRIQAAL
jgi:hypothetical protein